MARRIHEAGALHQVFDARADATQRFVRDTGVRAAPSLADMGAECDAVILMLPNGHVVHEVVVGADASEDHLVEKAAEGLVVIDMSSSAPMGTRALGEELAAKRIALLDAPVSGGVKKARSGDLSIIVGGGHSVLNQWRWLFETMGKALFATGPLGSGHAVKALNNYVSAAGLAAAAEALRVAEMFGVDGSVLIDVLNASTGRNNSTENKFKQFILSGSYDSGFALDLMAKDLGTAVELARQSGLETPLMERCSDLWSQVSAELGTGADHTEYMRCLRARKTHG